MRLARLLSLPLAGLLGLALAAPGLAEPPPLPEASSATGVAAAAEGRGHRHSHGPDPVTVDGRGSVVAAPVDDALTGPWSTSNPLPVLTADAPDVHGGLSQVHLVYLHGSEVKRPRTQFLNMFEADARAAQRFLQERYGRSLRLDERAGGRLDITVVKSRYRTSQLGGRNQFDLVSSELARVFPDPVGEQPRKKYLAWLDAPSSYCGQGELYGDWHRDEHNWNDLRTTGVVYRPYDASGADGGFCRGRTLLHELGHNLGALYGGAPNAFDGAHCDDDKNDVMCYESAATTSSGTTGVFDFGNDDYWDRGASPGSTNGDHLQHLNWWGVNLSRFVCRPSTAGGAPSCTDPSTHLAAAAEFRYHSGDTGVPPEVPTG